MLVLLNPWVRACAHPFFCLLALRVTSYPKTPEKRAGNPNSKKGGKLGCACAHPRVQQYQHFVLLNYHIMPICLIKKQQLQTYIDTLTVDQSSISVVYMWLQSSICGGATGSANRLALSPAP
jgi:hypothetical protein